MGLNIINQGPTKPRGVVGVLYGPEGIGKSTLAAALDKPLFLDVEKGAHGLNVAKLDEKATFANIVRVLKELKADSNGFRNLVIDTADALESALLDEMCAAKKWESIEDMAYGKGYMMFNDVFCKFLENCRSLAESGMNVVLVAHAEVKRFETPDERGSYDRWQLKLLKQNAPKLKECADFIVFINYKTNILTPDKASGETKSHATGGRRWCYCSHMPAFDAKCRCFIDLPEECSLGEMTKKLPVALRNATSDAPVPAAKKPQPAKQAPAKKPEEPPVPEPQEEPEESASSRPLVNEVRKYLKTYNATEKQLFDKYNHKHTERYGAVSSIEEWHDNFLDWIVNRGFAKGLIKFN